MYSNRDLAAHTRLKFRQVGTLFHSSLVFIGNWELELERERERETTARRRGGDTIAIAIAIGGEGGGKEEDEREREVLPNLSLFELALLAISFASRSTR